MVCTGEDSIWWEFSNLEKIRVTNVQQCWMKKLVAVSRSILRQRFDVLDPYPEVNNYYT
jgi:hypothetical protein